MLCSLVHLNIDTELPRQQDHKYMSFGMWICIIWTGSYKNENSVTIYWLSCCFQWTQLKIFWKCSFCVIKSDILDPIQWKLQWHLLYGLKQLKWGSILLWDLPWQYVWCGYSDPQQGPPQTTEESTPNTFSQIELPHTDEPCNFTKQIGLKGDEYSKIDLRPT